MIFLSHPYESETKELLEERQRFASFLTRHIIRYMDGLPVLNFPLTYYGIQEELGMRRTDAEACRSSLSFLGKADAAIFIRFPGIEVCPRLDMERKAAKRLDIPTAELPFYRHRFDQQVKQDTLLADQKRVLNLLRSNLQNP